MAIQIGHPDCPRSVPAEDHSVCGPVQSRDSQIPVGPLPEHFEFIVLRLLDCSDALAEQYIYYMLVFKLLFDCQNRWICQKLSQSMVSWFYVFGIQATYSTSFHYMFLFECTTLLIYRYNRLYFEYNDLK